MPCYLRAECTLIYQIYESSTILAGRAFIFNHELTLIHTNKKREFLFKQPSHNGLLEIIGEDLRLETKISKNTYYQVLIEIEIYRVDIDSKPTNYFSINSNYTT